MIKSVELGNEAIEYIRGELSGGKDLAELLLQLPLETGQVITYVPAALNEQDIPAFNLSIFLTKNMKITPELREKTNEFISSYLQRSKEKYAIFESWTEVQDQWFQRERPVHFSFNSNVYFFLSHVDSDNEKVKSAISHAGAYPFIGILTNIDFTISNGEVFTKDKLEALAKSVDHIVIGAFDDESYLIWSKA